MSPTIATTGKVLSLCADRSFFPMPISSLLVAAFQSLDPHAHTLSISERERRSKHGEKSGQQPDWKQRAELDWKGQLKVA